jgi:hypothetical protein
MTAPIASGGSEFAGWDLHPLESAALTRRTPIVDINGKRRSPFEKATWGSITFRTYFNPVTVGCFVMHCHILDHEDLGMMQRLDIIPKRGQSSGCKVAGNHAALPQIERLLGGGRQFAMCSAVRRSEWVKDGSGPLAEVSDLPADTGR